MQLVSTTGPKVTFILFLHFFQNTVVSMQLGKIPTLGSCIKIYHYKAHTWTQMKIFGILNCIVTVIKSNQIHVFLTFQTNNPNNQDNLPQMQQFLSTTKGIPWIFAIFEPFPTYLISFLVETSRIPQIFRTGHQHYSNFSNNTEYTLQLQASTQPTMLRMVLGHNPNALMTV